MRCALSLVVCAGAACVSSAEPLEQVEAVHAQSATKIEAMRTDGSFVLGRTIYFGDAMSRGGCIEYAFDQFSWIASCGGNDVFPQSGVLQSAVEDFVSIPSQVGSGLSGFSLAAARPLCDAGAGTTAEEFHLVLEMWEGVDNVAQLDGTDGFPTETPGLVTPMHIGDTDGDTIVDGFIGGIILTYADTDTDGDTLNDAMSSSGFRVYSATGLETLGIPLPEGSDIYDGASNPAPDGIPDGGIKVTLTRGDGGDGNGPLANGFYPSTNARLAFGATAENDPSGCLMSFELGNGSSSGTLWAEGYSECNGGAGWSDGSSSGGVDDLYDPAVDIRNLDGVVAGLDSIGLAISICGGGEIFPGTDCCDTNQDGYCTPADFTAWVAAFNSNMPTCDSNQDSVCDPTDFTAWLNAYNASQSGNPQLCLF
ncbi:MAG: hypothetical protein ED559_10430 [Phycisphaera sp.]|nr:MAG: hypothetical protein ED559_10430 [Phycisphaera sp.]